MRPITDAIGQDLVWIERGRPGPPRDWGLGREHELRLGDDVVAILRFQAGLPSEAEADGHRWTFERLKQERARPHGPAVRRVLESLGLLWQELRSTSPIVVRDLESRDVALLWRGNTLEFEDGNQLRFGRWRRRGTQRLVWIWEDVTQEFIQLEERSHKNGQALAFQIQSTAAETNRLPLSWSIVRSSLSALELVPAKVGKAVFSARASSTAAGWFFSGRPSSQPWSL
jgi:hypothetical protein